METFTNQRPIWHWHGSLSLTSGSCGGCPPSRRSAWNLKKSRGTGWWAPRFFGAKLETHGTAEESEVLTYDQRIRESPVPTRCGKNMEEPPRILPQSSPINQHHVEKASPAGFHLLFGGLDGPSTFLFAPLKSFKELSWHGIAGTWCDSTKNAKECVSCQLENWWNSNLRFLQGFYLSLRPKIHLRFM
jgi:hypothetical protein